MIITPIRTRVRCDMFPCRHIAEYSIGEKGRRLLNFNVCEKHLRQIVEEGVAILGEAIKANYETYVNPPKDDELLPFEPEKEGIIEEQEEEQEEASPEEFYSCKYCGEQFPKTKEGRTELMNHSRACKKERA